MVFVLWVFCKWGQGGEGRSSLHCLVLWSPVFLRCYLPAVLFTDGNKEGEVDPRYILSFCDQLCFVFCYLPVFCLQVWTRRWSQTLATSSRSVITCVVTGLSLCLCLSVCLSVHLCLCLSLSLSLWLSVSSHSSLLQVSRYVIACFFFFFHLLAFFYLLAGANKEGQLEFCDHLCILLFCL